MTDITIVAVIGTGGIGASWAAYFLGQGLTVHAYDPRADGEIQLRESIRLAWATVPKTEAASADPPWTKLQWASDVEEAVAAAEFVQENGPEAIDLKRDLFTRIGNGAPPNAILATSSSSLLVSDIQDAAEHPQRVVLGHPFSPPHLVPLVEVGGGRLTSEQSIERAISFYRRIGKEPIRLNREIVGHLANRLQVAVWREAFHLIACGLTSAEDVDRALTVGPGLRWAALGPCAVMHAAGGSGGIRSTLAHMGPAMNAIAEDLYTGPFTADMFEAVSASTETIAAGKTAEEMTQHRDAVLSRILRSRRPAA